MRQKNAKTCDKNYKRKIMRKKQSQETQGKKSNKLRPQKAIQIPKEKVQTNIPKKKTVTKKTTKKVNQRQENTIKNAEERGLKI